MGPALRGNVIVAVIEESAEQEARKLRDTRCLRRLILGLESHPLAPDTALIPRQLPGKQNGQEPVSNQS